MKYKAVIRYKDKAGKINEESVSLTAFSEGDAKTQLHFIQEGMKMQYGKANVISVTLRKIEEENL